MTYEYDYLVIGSGIAGMSFALKAAENARVALICKTSMEEANTYFAQGGVASVTNFETDNFTKHIKDTLIAGDWLSDTAAVEMVVKGGPDRMKELIEWGVNFDKNENGEFDLHREGGHSEFRILHHADNTGAEIQTSLIKAVRQHKNIDIFEHHFAIEILTQHHLGKIVTRRTPDITCYGAYVLNQQTGSVDKFLSRVTLMATGGVGAVYKTTTNPLIATASQWSIAPKAQSATWNSYNSTPQHSTIPATARRSSSRKLCAATEQCCETLTVRSLCTSMTRVCRSHHATSSLVPSTPK